MNTHHGPDVDLLIRTTAAPDAVTVVLDGELDYDTSDALLAAVDRLLCERDETVRDLRLDCRALRLVDTMGLSTLLEIHRRTTHAGLTLHLDGRPPMLDRLLRLTDTWEHFTSVDGT